MKKTFLNSLILLSLFGTIGGGVLVHAQEPKGPGINPPTGPGTDPPTGPGINPPTGPGINPPTSVTSIKIENPFNSKVGNSLFGLVKAIVNNIVLPVGGILCVLAFIYAGFKYVMAQGNSTKLEEANRTLLYAAIGTAVLLGAWVLANAVCETLNLLGANVTCPK